MIGQKFDQGKLQYDLIPFECLDELAKILTYGAEKYGKPSGWESVPNMENRYFAAAMRHLSAYRQGETLDAESGHRHLSHALCNIVFLLWKELQKRPAPLQDDFPREDPVPFDLRESLLDAKAHPHRHPADRAVYGDVNIPPQEGLDYRPGLCPCCGFEIGHAGWCEGAEG